ncbi:MAG: hypothetical protein ACT4O9_07080, partial [Blastocatellia bacterium]
MKAKVNGKKPKGRSKSSGRNRLTILACCFPYFISLCLCVSAVKFTASAQTGGTFTITKSVIAGGGGRTAGGAFTVDGTIGQSVAGTTST